MTEGKDFHTGYIANAESKHANVINGSDIFPSNGKG